MDLYYDFYNYWNEFHSDSSTDCESTCGLQYDCTEETGLSACVVDYCADDCTGDYTYCMAVFNYNGLEEVIDCETFYALYVDYTDDCTAEYYCESLDCTEDSGLA